VEGGLLLAPLLLLQLLQLLREAGLALPLILERLELLLLLELLLVLVLVLEVLLVVLGLV